MASQPPAAELTSRRWPAEEILGRAARAVPGPVSLACSFQKEESVLLDMLFALDPKARVFALDTHVLFPETYAFWREVERALRHEDRGLRGPARTAGRAHGESSGSASPTSLAIRKVEPLGRALGGLDAWITGIRRDQSPTRADAPKLGWDEQHELWKANPLADWSDERCWDYIRERGLPYNPLHDQGYASIGDTH